MSFTETQAVQSWQRTCVVGVFTLREFERLHHAGLSADGRRCFVASADEDYAVVDTFTGECLWTDLTTSDSDVPALDEWVQDGWIDLRDGPAPGRYRVFGLYLKSPLVRAESPGVELDLEVEQANLRIRDIQSGAIVQALPYEVFSGDWAFASFSDDFSTIAVIEPYYVTLFRQVEVCEDGPTS